MKPEVWAGMAAMLHDHGLLNAPIDAVEVYTYGFLKEVYSVQE